MPYNPQSALRQAQGGLSKPKTAIRRSTSLTALSLSNGNPQLAHLLPLTSHLILHVDVDAFFASVEQLLIPSLRSRAVIVGTGVIASCSYEARRFGLRAGMPLGRARRLCPSAVILKGDYQIYRCFAEQVWDICSRYTTSLETYLDEAYGDAGGMEGIHGDPLSLGRKLQHDVREAVGLTVSVGLAANRMLAKIASASAKPAGVVWIRPGEAESFLAPLPVEKLCGVGCKTARRLGDCNIATVADLRRLSRESLRSMFSRRGELLYEQCRGREGGTGQRPVLPRRLSRTISRETTFHRPTCDRGEIRGMLFYLLERAMRTMRRAGLRAGRVELSIRYDDWKQFAAGRSLDSPSQDDGEVFAVVMRLLEQLHRRRVALRHAGIVLSRFSSASHPALFEAARQVRRSELYHAVDSIRARYGHASIVTGESIGLLGRLEQNDYGFVLRTPSLTK